MIHAHFRTHPIPFTFLSRRSAGDLSAKQPSPSTGTKEASLKMLSIPRGPVNSDHPHDGRRGNSDIGLLLVKDATSGKIVVRQCSRQVRSE